MKGPSDTADRNTLYPSLDWSWSKCEASKKGKPAYSEGLIMIDPVTAAAAITVISSAVKLADGIWDSWRDFKEHRRVTHEPSSEHYELVEATDDGGALVHSVDGVGC